MRTGDRLAGDQPDRREGQQDAEPDQPPGALAGQGADQDRHHHGADPGDRCDHAHPSRRQAAVEEGGAEAVGDATGDRPAEVGCGGGAAGERDDDEHHRRTPELGDQRDRPGAAAPREQPAVEVAEAVRRRREQRQQHRHVTTTP